MAGALKVGVEVGDIPITRFAEEAGGSGTEAEVGLVVPVTQIVAAGVVRAGEVADFVVFEVGGG